MLTMLAAAAIDKDVQSTNNDGSINVDDAVYLIAYVFKGGPAPCDCDTWLINCGPPLRK